MSDFRARVKRNIVDEMQEKAAVKSSSSPEEQEMARRELAANVWSPHYELPRPATRPERIAAEMMTGAHLKAAELGLNLGEVLTAVLYFAGEPEARTLRIAEYGDLIAEIAEAMVEAGRAAAQTIPETYAALRSRE